MSRQIRSSIVQPPSSPSGRTALKIATRPRARAASSAAQAPGGTGPQCGSRLTRAPSQSEARTASQAAACVRPVHGTRQACGADEERRDES
jgi:hypothetical protein